MSDRADSGIKSCAVCGRRLLPGELPTTYVTDEGSEVEVCELCKPRAEAAGWLRPEEVAAGTAPAGDRRRRQRGDLFAGLRGMRGRGGRRRQRSERAEETAEEREESAQPDEPVEPERAERPAPERSTPPPERVRGRGSLDPNLALEAFNASEYSRTVAGLSRSLGPARATAIAVHTAEGGAGLRITVAWELAWYQWEVAPGERGPRVRQTAKGETVDQLRAADRNWNLEVADDGNLARRRSAAE